MTLGNNGRRALIAAGLLASASAAAQSNTSQMAASSNALDTVTIIGHTRDVADVPGSAHVVTSAELEVFLQTDIMRVLRTVPGVYVQEEEGFGLRPNIGIRGSGLDRSARIALLEDGVLIAPAPYAASSAYYFPTQRRMSSIEVLKGPAAVAVGPRTTGGALNLLSTPIPDSFAANLDVRGGDYDTLDAHINIGQGGERFSWLFETVQAESDGFKIIDGPVGGSTGYDIEDYVAKFQFDSDPASDLYQSLRFKFGYTDQTSDETYVGLTEADFAVDPLRRYAASANDNFASEHEQYQLTYVVDPGNAWRAEVTGYRNDFARNWYKLQSVGGVGISSVLDDPTTNAIEFGYLTGATSPDDDLQIRANNRDYYSQGIQARFEWDTGIGDTDISLDFGVRVHEDEEDRFQHQDGYRMENGELVLTTEASGGSQTNRVSTAEARSVFVDAEIRNGRWIFTPGMRFEDIDLVRFDFSTADPSRAAGPTRVRENSVSVLIPGMGALYRVSDDWRLLAGIHKGFNPPGPGSSANEESSLNVELGVRFDNDALSFESIYFINDYDNLVGTVTDSTGGGGVIGDQFDGGEAIVQGLEMTAEYTFASGSLQFPTSLNYTWTTEAEFENAFDSSFDPWGEVEIGDELPYIPEHQVRATAGIRTDLFRVNIAAAYVDRMRTRAGQGGFESLETIDSHVVWDVVAAWNVSQSLSTYIKIDNLLDEEYAAARRPAGLRPGLPRTAYVGFTYRL